MVYPTNNIFLQFSKQMLCLTNYRFCPWNSQLWMRIEPGPLEAVGICDKLDLFTNLSVCYKLDLFTNLSVCYKLDHCTNHSAVCHELEHFRNQSVVGMCDNIFFNKIPNSYQLLSFYKNQPAAAVCDKLNLSTNHNKINLHFLCLTMSSSV